MTGQVIAIGDALVDLIVKVSNYPSRGGNVWGSAIEMCPGGTAANFAVGLARLGVAVAFLGKLGDDAYGHFLLRDLQQEGIETTYTVVDRSEYTGAVFIPVDAEGERTFFACAKGAAHARLRPQEIDPGVVGGAQWLHATGVCLAEGSAREAVLKAMGLAKDAGVPISFDPNLRLEGDLFPAGLREALDVAFHLAEFALVSADELELLGGAQSIEAGAKEILKDGARIVVVKCGAAGAVALSRNRRVAIPAFPVSVVDTTGAGDAFDAGFVAGWLRGLDQAEAIRYANAVAGLKIMGVGARALPRASEVDHFLHRVSAKEETYAKGFAEDH